MRVRISFNIIMTAAAILLIGFLKEVSCSEWIYFGEAQSGKWYYDKQSIKNIGDGNVKKVWRQVIYSSNGSKRDQEYLMSKGIKTRKDGRLSKDISLLEFDCKATRFRRVLTSVNDENDVNIYISTKETEWENTIPETVADKLRDIVCK